MMNCGFRLTFKKAFMGKKEREGPRYQKVSSSPIPVALQEEIIPRLLMAHRRKASSIKKKAEFENASKIVEITAERRRA